MKKLAVFTVLLLSCAFVFAEFQLETSDGYFFNTDNYDGVKRSFNNGLDSNITMRYLFTENIGIFFGTGFKAWFSADNREYEKLLNESGDKYTFDDTVGLKLDFNFGIALALPINDNFAIQGDLGMSTTLLGLEVISGKVYTAAYPYTPVNLGIFTDSISSLGIYASVFGKLRVLSMNNSNSSFIFGVKIDWKFNREESGEVIISGISDRYSDKVDNFSGFAICPFVGWLYSF